MDINIQKFIAVVGLLTGLIALLAINLFYPGYVEAVIRGQEYSPESNNAITESNASSKDKNTVYNKNSSEMIVYINDTVNLTISNLFYASEDVNYMNVTGIVLDVKRDDYGKLDAIYFSAGYNITAVNAGDFPFYPGKVHSYRLKKIYITNESFYYLVDDVRMISEEKFVEFYKLTLNSEKTGIIDKLIESLPAYQDRNVSMAINGTKTVVIGDLDEIDKSSTNNISCTLRFKGGLKVPALNACTYNHNNVSKVIVLTDRIKVNDFTFFKIESIYSVEGQ